MNSEAPAVKTYTIKPLVWKQEGHRHLAQGVSVEYLCYQYETYCRAVFGFENDAFYSTISQHETIEQCKAACEKHHRDCVEYYLEEST